MTIEFVDVHSTPGAPDFLWDLMLARQEEDEFNISFTMPTREEHEAFLRSTPFNFWCLAIDAEECLAYISAGWRNEIGIVLDPDVRDQGYGKKILTKFLAECRPLPEEKGQRPGYFVANINPKNYRSIALFDSLGFTPVQTTYALKP